MATYTKETALFATNAIANDIGEAGTTASNYLTDITGGGVFVHEQDPNDPDGSGATDNGVKITDKVDIIRNGVSVAEFGTSARIGEQAYGKTSTVLSSDGMKVTYHDRNSDVDIASFGYGETYIDTDTTQYAPYYTLGERYPSSRRIGMYSVAEGVNVKAAGYASHAEGTDTEASASESHAEGYSSHATGSASHAEGEHTYATGDYSHSQNEYTRADFKAQTALGTCNVLDTTPESSVHPEGGEMGKLYGHYAVIVGNGTSIYNRSNALTVDWQGNVDAAGGYKVNGTDIFNVSTPTISITASTGTYVSSGIRKCGKVVQLYVTFRTASSVAAGANAFVATIGTTGLRPLINAYGSGFYGEHALIASLNSSGTITVRNASASAVSVTGNNSATVGFTYIVG